MPKLDELIKALQSDQLQIRSKAAYDLGSLAEQKRDLGSVLPTMKGLLSDPDAKIRDNIAWCLATIGAQGCNLVSIVPQMLERLLEKDTDERYNCIQALNYATRNPESSEKTVEYLQQALSHEVGSIRRLSSEILVLRKIEQETLDGVWELTSSEDSATQFGAVGGLAKGITGVEPSAALPHVIEFLSNKEEQIRFFGAHMLVTLAENGRDISSASSALCRVTSDSSLRVGKESVWALYLIVHQGHSTEEIADTLRACIAQQDTALHGNAAIGLTLHLLHQQRAQEVEQLMTADSSVAFGVAWAKTEYYCKQEDQDAMQVLIKAIQPGFMARDQFLRQGIAGCISYLGNRANFAEQLVQQIALQSEDPILSVGAHGVLQKLQQVRRK